MMNNTITLSLEEALPLALQLHRAGSFAEAEMLYGRVLEAVPDNLNALHFHGLLCHQQKRFAEAAARIERIIELDPHNADAFNNLGNVREGLGDPATAEECYRRAIALHSEHGPAHNNLGVILMARGAVDEALAAYRRAVELLPDSGDFLCNLGNALRRSGDIDGAIDAYRKAIVARPGYVASHQGLARAFIVADRQQEAVAVFDEWLREDPGNPVISYLRSACLGAGAPSRAPDAYVQQIFDDLADNFESHLAELEYRAPALLGEALAGVLASPAGTLDILDAGCGTGLCAPLLKPYAKRLLGVDLSARMLALAEAKQAYDQLIQAELAAFLGSRNEAFDLIVSSDTLCYFGELVPVFRAAAKALRAGGLLAFTLEDAGGEVGGVHLNQHGRYAHGRLYVEEALGAAGLQPRLFSPVVLRQEAKQPVAGHLVIAVKQEAV
jgi:predicted TPR repeat methyltransferase